MQPTHRLCPLGLMFMTPLRDRRLIASIVVAVVVALILHGAMIGFFYIGYLLSSTMPPGVVLLGSASNFLVFTSICTLVLLLIAGLIGAFDRWWSAVITGIVVAFLASFVGITITAASQGQAMSGALLLSVLRALLGFNLLYSVSAAVLIPTFGRWLFHVLENTSSRFRRASSLAFVRVPAPQLSADVADGVEIDADAIDQQWDSYVAALSEAGWTTAEVASADTLSSSVFVADTAVLFGEDAVIGRLSDEERRAETAGSEAALRSKGLHIHRIEEPGTLEGSDVLTVGGIVYVARSANTNAEGIRQLRAILEPLGYTVIAFPLTKAAHLNDAVTVLPDGSILGYEKSLDDSRIFNRFLPLPDAAGVGLVVLNQETILMPASATASIALVKDLGYTVVTVDVSEFDKLGRSLASLSVRRR